MNGTRTKNSMRNAIYGVMLQCASIVTKFISATFFVKLLGVEYSGLNGLFTEVIIMISLAEMGVGTAIVFNLYKPLAQNDIEKLKQLMGLFKKAYRLISLSVMCIGILLTPFIHLLVRKVDFDLNYIRIVFLLFVVQTASSYLFSYKSSLLNADQKTYVVSVINLISKVVLLGVNIAVLYLTHNYIVYLVSQIVVTVLTNMCVSLKADKVYPFLKHTTNLPKDERKAVFSNIKHLFIGGLSGRLTSATDNILISVLVGTDQVGVFYYYNLVMTSVVNIFSRISEAMLGSIGNMMLTEKPEHNHTVIKRFTFIFLSAAILFSIGFYCVAFPMITIWLGKDFILSEFVLIICVVNFFFFIAREPLWKTMQVSGLFAQDKNISLLGSAVNLVVSFGLGKYIGMSGIFIGTTCTLLIQIIMKSILLYNGRMGISGKGYYAIWIKMSVLFAADMVISKFVICQYVTFQSALLTFFARGICAVVLVAGTIYFTSFKTPEFKYAVSLVGHTLTGIGKKGK